MNTFWQGFVKKAKAIDPLQEWIEEDQLASEKAKQKQDVRVDAREIGEMLPDPWGRYYP
jgi:hypothetical protein